VGWVKGSVAIAYRAIQNGFEARFTTATALIEELSRATRAGKLRHVLPTYTHPHVLVIDEVGYLSYGPDAANVLFQVVNDRHLHRRPMLFTTNKPLGAWGTGPPRSRPGGSHPRPGPRTRPAPRAPRALLPDPASPA
jgi:hypothetical protein